MESNQDLFKQAILDAKAVRETAMAAARTTLAEHFEPRLKEMMQQQFSEDETQDEFDSQENENANTMSEDDSQMEEKALDEILAELDALSEDMKEESLEEGATGYDEKAKTTKGSMGYDEKAKTSHGDHKLHEADDEEAEDEDDDTEDAEDTPDGEDFDVPGEGDELGGDEQEVVDITVGDLKDIIRDVFMQLQGGEAAPETLDADTDLAADLGVDDQGLDQDDDSKEISLEEILAELEDEEKKMEESAKVPGKHNPTGVSNVDLVSDVKDELNEAVKVIKALKTELNEINLFSAKLLYVNKIFKAKNLSEAQKTKVINAFDRAISIKEVENTFKTLTESLGEVTKKTSLKESVGYASKPIGNAPVRPIVETDSFVTRWQTLAGIK